VDGVRAIRVADHWDERHRRQRSNGYRCRANALRHRVADSPDRKAARLLTTLGDEEPENDAAAVRFLIHDRDSKFTRAFDDLWHAVGAQVIRTPIQAPNANAVAERWVGTVRRECLDHLLIAGRRQLLHVLHLYVEHYNRHRPHRGLDLSAPAPSECCEQADPSAAARQLHRRDVLGGLIHEYERAA
jgi:putative transposase